MGQCIDIAIEIHPHLEIIFPGGVERMTALDPELSASPLTV